MTVLEQLAEFIADAEGKFGQSKWLSDDLMEVYVRRGMHSIEGKQRICLDIANVNVYKQQQGTWTDFLWKAHELNPWDCTFVECVHNEHLVASLLRSGFMPTPTMESFYLPKKPEEWNAENRNLSRGRRSL